MRATVHSLLLFAGDVLPPGDAEVRHHIARATALLGAEPEGADGPAAGDARPEWRPARGGLAPWQLCRVTRHVDDNLSQSITLQDLADIAKLSVSYFAQAFRTTVGLSPQGYVRQRRVDLAKMLIAETDAPLCDIAGQCGFADQSHLTRVFRAHTGTSPASWRRLRQMPT